MTARRFSGIYKIESKSKPNRIYIGSAIYVNKRHGEHLRLLRYGKHHSIKLQRHYNKYGEDDLVFCVIEKCDLNNLISKEQYYLDLYNPYFNYRRVAKSRFGTGHSMETREKQRIAHLGIKPSEETRMKQSLIRRRENLSEETLIKMRESGKKYRPTEETKEKIRKSWIERRLNGTDNSIEHKNKLKINKRESN